MFLTFLHLCYLLGGTQASISMAKPSQWALQSSHEPFESLPDVQALLKAADIIPSVIDDFVPKYYLHADWPDHQHANLGNTLDPGELKAQPAVKLYSDSPHANHDDLTYIVTITDPDAPSHDDPEWSEFCHFIATNMPAPRPLPDQRMGPSDHTTASRAGLTDIMSYKPPAPPAKTGKHRYVFLVFTPGNGTTDALHLSKPSGRKHWGHKHAGHGVREWAWENGLVPVGELYHTHIAFGVL